MNVRDHFWAGLERLAQARLGKGNGANVGSNQREARQTVLLAGRYDVVIDAGAHRGDWSDALLRHVNPRTLVLIDADPANEVGLRERFGGRANVTIEATALSDRDDSAVLYSNKAGTQVASLYDRGHTSAGAFVPIANVTTTSLKTLLDRLALDRVDILKLDIEGHELTVLTAAHRDCVLDRIDTIQFEFGECNIDSGTYMRDFWNLLSPDYAFYRIAPGRPILVPHYRKRDETFLTTNYICKRRS